MEWILHNKHYSKEVKMAVVVVVIGVGVCTITDVKVNAKGFLCACVAVLSTSLQQIVSIFSILSAHRLVDLTQLHDRSHYSHWFFCNSCSALNLL